MEALREWLLAVLAASLLVAAAQMIMPEGPVKGVGRLICGLLLFLAVSRPVLGLQYETLSAMLREAYDQLAQEQTQLEEAGDQLTQSIIVRETDAYIEDKSQELGLDCRAAVCWDWSGTVPVPSGVTVFGSLTQAQQERLTQALVEDLGLEADAIVYDESDEEVP